MPSPDPNCYHWRRLACAIVERAVRDAKSADAGRATEARAWLASEALDFLDALDIPAERVARWVAELAPVAQLALW